MRYYLSILLLIMSFSVTGQLETHNWFLNESRISVKPSGVSFGLPNPPVDFLVPVASTSISDLSGNLLFATNGNTIINRDYAVMPALNNINLAGNYGKVLIQQIPGTSKYYVFYTINNKDDWQGNSSYTLYYCIVDLSLQGGKGDVTVYNQVIESKSSPSYALIEGSLPDEAWLVVHKCATDSFQSYRITNTGIGSTPIISKAGSNNIKLDYVFRDIKASFDGSMIAGLSYRNYSINFAETYSLLEVFNFNGLTGQLTSRTRTPRTFGYFFNNWSAEFSPDNRLVYSTMVTRAYGLQPCGFGSGIITQYNLCYSDTTEFKLYSKTIASDFKFCAPDVSWGKMLLGADKKMHIPYSGNIISQINYPNRIGSSANFVFNAYTAPNSNNTMVGTPQFNPITMKRAVQNNIVYDGGCHPSPFQFHVTNKNISNLSWNFGDPGGSDNTSNLSNPSHVFSKPGNYEITVRFLDNLIGQLQTISDTIEVRNPDERLLVSYPKDTVLCGINKNFLNIKLKVTNGIFHWYQRDESRRMYNSKVSDSISITSTGTWYVEMKQNDCNGCSMQDSIQVTIIEKTGTLGSDRFLCQSDSIMLAIAPDPNAEYTWNTGSTSNKISVNSPGIYWLLANYPKDGCMFRDSVTIIGAEKISLKLPEDTILCTGESILLNPAIPNSFYQWQNGSTLPKFTVSEPGLYWVKVTNMQSCSIIDSINVNYAFAKKPDLGRDTALCLGETLTLTSDIITGNFLWSTGEKGNTIKVTQMNNYWLQVNNGVCTITDTIAVNFLKPPNLFLGSDTTICNQDQLVLNPGINNAIYKWQDGSSENQFTVIQPGFYWLMIEQNHCIVRDTIEIQYLSSPRINLGVDIRFCLGDSIIIDAGSGFTEYRWNTGQTTRTLTLSSPGNYIVRAKTNNLCLSRDTIVVLNPYPLPFVNLGNSGPICINSKKELDAGKSFSEYFWNNGSTTQSITVQNTGLYSVQVKDFNGCKATDSIEITALLPAPNNFLPSDSIICKYQPLKLIPQGAFSQYTWSTGNSGQEITVSQPGIYWLRVADKNNCIGTDTIILTQKDCLTGMNIPNAFTPGNDGKNDLFRPIYSGTVLEYRFTVYNRFGEIVFSSTYPDQSWDGNFRGKAQPSGVYAWVFQYQLFGQSPQSEKGTVMLIR